MYSRAKNSRYVIFLIRVDHTKEFRETSCRSDYNVDRILPRTNCVLLVNYITLPRLYMYFYGNVRKLKTFVYILVIFKMFRVYLLDSECKI